MSLSYDESTKTATAGRNQTDDLAKALPELAGLLDQPNALLALEYAKAILALPSPLAMQTVPRRGSHAENGFDQPFTSASAIRRELKKAFRPASQPICLRPAEAISKSY